MGSDLLNKYLGRDDFGEELKARRYHPGEMRAEESAGDIIWGLYNMSIGIMNGS